MEISNGRNLIRPLQGDTLKQRNNMYVCVRLCVSMPKHNMTKHDSKESTYFGVNVEDHLWILLYKP